MSLWQLLNSWVVACTGGAHQQGCCGLETLETDRERLLDCSSTIAGRTDYTQNPSPRWTTMVNTLNPDSSHNSYHLRQERSHPLPDYIETWRRRLRLGPQPAEVRVRERWDDDFVEPSSAPLELPTAFKLSQRSIQQDLVSVRELTELVDWLKSLETAVLHCLQAAPSDNVGLARKTLHSQLEHNWQQATFLIDLVEQSSSTAAYQLEHHGLPPFMCTPATPEQTPPACSPRPSVDSGIGAHPASLHTEGETASNDEPESDNGFIQEDDRCHYLPTAPPGLRAAENMTLLQRLLEYRTLVQEHQADATVTTSSGTTPLPPIMLTVDNLKVLVTECKSLVASIETSLAELQL
ncbi:hypothetical protein IWQ62_005562 [Dispira parvispora]|uniref:Uncharacterized protein n=1 Tax=Dispira parvispora TaxID=1520584 RepID=A0A9W8AQQ3_9FUNG|nr:hypothetical protein IWQ62_005562 [Dispira parvispora]